MLLSIEYVVYSFIEIYLKKNASDFDSSTNTGKECIASKSIVLEASLSSTYDFHLLGCFFCVFFMFDTLNSLLVQSDRISSSVASIKIFP